MRNRAVFQRVQSFPRVTSAQLHGNLLITNVRTKEEEKVFRVCLKISAQRQDEVGGPPKNAQARARV